MRSQWLDLGDRISLIQSEWSDLGDGILVIRSWWSNLGDCISVIRYQGSVIGSQLLDLGDLISATGSRWSVIDLNGQISGIRSWWWDLGIWSWWPNLGDPILVIGSWWLMGVLREALTLVPVFRVTADGNNLKHQKKPSSSQRLLSFPFCSPTWYPWLQTMCMACRLWKAVFLKCCRLQLYFKNCILWQQQVFVCCNSFSLEILIKDELTQGVSQLL